MKCAVFDCGCLSVWALGHRLHVCACTLFHMLKIMVVSYLLFKVMLCAALHHLTVTLHHIMLSIHGVFFSAVDVAQSCHLIAHCIAWSNYCILLVMNTMCSVVAKWHFKHCFSHARVMSNLVCWPSVSSFFVDSTAGYSKCFFRWLGIRLGLCEGLTWDENSHVL